MCELLVKNSDAISSDPARDKSEMFKAGDVISIMPDAHAWGAGELNSGIFAVVKFPGVPVADMQYLANPERAAPPSTAAMKIPALAKFLLRKPRQTITARRYNLDISTSVITDKSRP